MQKWIFFQHAIIYQSSTVSLIQSIFSHSFTRLITYTSIHSLTITQLSDKTIAVDTLFTSISLHDLHTTLHM